MLDRNGYRPNVCIVLVNDEGRVFWGKRISEHAWQFPQGGVRRGETLWHAALRELYEEVGLRPGHVEIIGRTEKWLYYDVPARWVRNHRYKGQKQIWFLLRLTGSESDINLQTSDRPEFDAWEWIDYWSPIEKVIDFKRLVYQKALQELSSFLPAQKNLQPLAASLRSSS